MSSSLAYGLTESIPTARAHLGAAQTSLGVARPARLGEGGAAARAVQASPGPAPALPFSRFSFATLAVAHLC